MKGKCCLILVLGLAVSLFAANSWDGSKTDEEKVQETAKVSNYDIIRQVDSLIQSGVFENTRSIETQASSLSEKDRFFLYNDCAKSPALGFALNMAFPFGIGSYIMGDVGGGVFTTLTHGVGHFLIFGGMTIFTTKKGFRNVPNYTLMAIGSISVITGTIFSWIRPFVFAADYNRALKRSLGVAHMPVDVDWQFGLHQDKNTDDINGGTFGLSFRF